MKSPPAFQFYVDNFIEGTVEMTDSEVGLYIRLLCAQWSRGSLPNDEKELARFSRGSSSVEADVSRVKSKFALCPDGRLRNDRLELERCKQIAFRELQSTKGKGSAQARLRLGIGSVEARGQPNGNSPSPSSPHKERSSERLHGIPSTEQEVIDYGKTLNPPKDAETCRQFFSHYESQALTGPSGETFWITGSGSVITKWKAKLSSFGGERNGNGGQPKPNGKRKGPYDGMTEDEKNKAILRDAIG